MAFLPLSEQMQKRNSEYYTSPKTKIHRDFKTYAQSPDGMLPKACAADFYRHNCAEDEEETPLHVLEIGVGEGNFGRGFLAELQNLDRKNKTDLSERTTYCIADFSKSMLQKAEKSITGAGFSAVECFVFDAAKCDLSRGISNHNYNNIYCNELFSDLPADAFVRDGMKIYAINYNGKMEADLGQSSLSDELALSLLESLPQQFYLPINSIAAESAQKIAGLLSTAGCFDIFDYGFYFAEDFAIPLQMWNAAIVRQYGLQWTVDLNFIYLTAKLASSGFRAKTEKQKEFAENALGEKLSIAEGKKGLTYSKSNTAAEEFDGFYHLRVEKK